ncbi:hypothetical protein BpHYR1_022383 [Brachionus plicatilis]|uniref:Uncharacterized protein n=1 Tax=Brachionus plicatilis TaxID=10195 RepID=A0A3M7T3K5_BRAPC|nr:hypothetical protein BpHYR1_022383 [Brachionus plicatilis]
MDIYKIIISDKPPIRRNKKQNINDYFIAFITSQNNKPSWFIAEKFEFNIRNLKKQLSFMDKLAKRNKIKQIMLNITGDE